MNGAVNSLEKRLDANETEEDIEDFLHAKSPEKLYTSACSFQGIHEGERYQRKAFPQACHQANRLARHCETRKDFACVYYRKLHPLRYTSLQAA